MHPIAGADTLEFIDLHRAGNTSKRHRTDSLYSNEALRQGERVACQEYRAGSRKRLHPFRDMYCDAVEAQVDEIFSLSVDGHNNRTGIDPDPDFKKHSELAPNFSGPNARCLLHVERGVAGPDSVIFEGDWRSKAGHDPIAFFAGHPPIVVDDLDHSVDSGFENLASILRIALVN